MVLNHKIALFDIFHKIPEWLFSKWLSSVTNACRRVLELFSATKTRPRNIQVSTGGWTVLIPPTWTDYLLIRTRDSCGGLPRLRTVSWWPSWSRRSLTWSFTMRRSLLWTRWIISTVLRTWSTVTILRMMRRKQHHQGQQRRACLVLLLHLHSE